MLTRLKKHNDSLFLILLLILLSGSAWFLNHNMSDKVSFLEKEVYKIEKQDISFLKQNTDLLAKKKSIQENIDNYLKLQSNIQQNKTEDLKKDLSQNSKSSELLSILPPSEIANIQQKESTKKITDDIVSFKEQSAIFWQSINKLSSEDFSDSQFVIGNISDSSLKSSLASDITTFLKKEKENFSTIASYDNDFEKFGTATEKLDQILPLLKTQQAKNKQIIRTKIDSLNQELYVIQIVSVVGLVALLLVLFFVIYRKNKKLKTVGNEVNDIIDYDQSLAHTTTEIKTEHVIELTLYDQFLSLVNDLNTHLHKNVNLHFDMDDFDSLTIEQQSHLNEMLSQLIKFSLVYSFNEEQSGDIIISLRENNELKQIIFKDNGKGLFVEQLKAKIKEQYSVSDDVFVGKSNQQIMSFIFKQGFELVPSLTDSHYNLQLHVVAQIVKELNATMGLSSKENHGTEFTIQFKSI